MKLILENWNNFINEQAEGGGIELYHATCAQPEAFAKGIDVSLAKGYGQGEGFYLFTKKDRAIRHAEELINDDLEKQVKIDCSKGAYIVIVDEPVTPENFDVDYELYDRFVAAFILENAEMLEYTKKYIQKIPDFKTTKFINLDGASIAGFKYRGQSIGLQNIASGYSARGGPERGELFGKLMSNLLKDKPDLFKQFEEQFLSNATVIKYNGKKKIFPLRIEDLEGKTVWSRK